MLKIIIDSLIKKRQLIRLSVIISIITSSLIYNFNGHFWNERENSYYHLLFLVVVCFILFINKSVKIRLNKLDIIVISFLLCAFFTRFIRVKSLNDIHILLTLVFIIYYLLVANCKLTNKTIVVYYFLLIILSILLCVFCLLEYYKVIEPVSYYWRLTGNFSNPALLGGFISILIPYSLFYFFLLKKNKIKMFLGILITCFQLYIVYLSNSRTSIICCFFSLIILFIFKTNKKNIKFLFPISIAIIYCILTIKSYNSFNGRILIWKISLLNFFKNPLVGIGYNFFHVDYINYQSNYFSKNFLDKEILLAGVTKYAFNEFLKFFIENGVLGLSLVFFSFFKLKKYLFNLKNTSFVTLQLLFFSSFFIFSMFSYPLHFLPFKLILLNQLAFIKLKRKTILNLKYKQNIFISSVLIILFVTGICKIRGVYLWKQGYYLQNKDLNKSFKIYSRVEKIMYNNGMFLFDYAKLQQIKSNIKAIYLYNKSLNTYNTLQTHSNLSMLYEKEKLLIKAEESLKKAHFVKPILFSSQEKLLDFYITHKNEKGIVLTVNKIIQAPIKINSKEVQRIKNKAKWLKKRNKYFFVSKKHVF